MLISMLKIEQFDPILPCFDDFILGIEETTGYALASTTADLLYTQERPQFVTEDTAVRCVSCSTLTCLFSKFQYTTSPS